MVDRVKNLFLGSSGPPVADALPRQRSRTPFPSMSCLTDGCGVSMDRGRSTEGSTSQTPLQAALARNHRSKHFLSAVDVHTTVISPPRVKTGSGPLCSERPRCVSGKQNTRAIPLKQLCCVSVENRLPPRRRFFMLPTASSTPTRLTRGAPPPPSPPR